MKAGQRERLQPERGEETGRRGARSAGPGQAVSSDPAAHPLSRGEWESRRRPASGAAPLSHCPDLWHLQLNPHILSLADCAQEGAGPRNRSPWLPAPLARDLTPLSPRWLSTSPSPAYTCKRSCASCLQFLPGCWFLLKRRNRKRLRAAACSCPGATQRGPHADVLGRWAVFGGGRWLSCLPHQRQAHLPSATLPG